MIRSVLALLLLFVLGEVNAGIPAGCPTSAAGGEQHSTRASASQECQRCTAGYVAYLNEASPEPPNHSGAHCVTIENDGGTFDVFRGKFTNTQGELVNYATFSYPGSEMCTPPATWNFDTHACSIPNTCPGRPDVLGDWEGNPDGTVGPWTVCHDGCEWDSALDSRSPNGIAYSVTGEQCTTGNTPVLDGDADGDGIPDSTDTDSGTDGGSNGADGGDTGSPGDPPGTGPGDETDNRAEGGANCVQPPVCSGDGIQCNILYQNWKTRCALELAQSADGKLKVTGDESGGAIAVSGGTGSDLSVEGTTGEDIGNPSNGGDHPGVGDVFQNADLAAAIAAGPDESGFGLAEVCPLLTLPNLVLSFGTAVMPWADMCDWLSNLGALIVLAGLIQWGFIVGKIGS